MSKYIIPSNIDKQPNKKTIRAMEDSLNGKMYKADCFEEFLQQMAILAKKNKSSQLKF